MNNEQETLKPFLSALAPALGDVFSQFTGSEWKVAPSPEAAQPQAAAAAPVEAQAEAVQPQDAAVTPAEGQAETAQPQDAAATPAEGQAETAQPQAAAVTPAEGQADAAQPQAAAASPAEGQAETAQPQDAAATPAEGQAEAAQPQAAAASPTEGEAVPAAASEPVCYKLEFAGAVEGAATLQVARELAAVVAAQILGEAAETAVQDFNDERSEALLEAIRAAVKQCAGTLGSERGATSVQVEISTEPVEPGAASSSLQVQEGGNARPGITIAFAPALVESLAKPPAPPEPAKSEPAPAPAQKEVPVAASTFQPLPTGKTTFDEAQLGLILDVELNVTLRFGQRQLSLREILDLSAGSVIELDRQVDEPVELLLDGRVIARGEAVIVDGNYGLRVTESPQVVRAAMMN